MKERPILFSGEMVKAIIAWQKTQTRRLRGLNKINSNPDIHAKACQDGGGNWVFWYPDRPGLEEATKKLYPNGEGIPCPYGKVGDRLWVRETFCDNGGGEYEYKATSYSHAGSWSPSIHMPRRASRITLEVVSVRAERLQEITEEDAQSEGVKPLLPVADERYRPAFRNLWDQINGENSPWDLNPWVWVIGFKPVFMAIG